MEREIATQRFGAADTLAQCTEMLDLSGKLRESLNEPGHRESAASLSRRMRSRNGSRSAARN